MGAVYRVRDLKTNKRFALKRSRSGDGAKSARRRAMLEREFHTLAQLRHPRIIEVYDYGVDEHGSYYTMELLDGADLDQSGRLPWREACALLRDIASSLAIVHSRGLLHRDVSTRNVRRTARAISRASRLAVDLVSSPFTAAPSSNQVRSKPEVTTSSVLRTAHQWASTLDSPDARAAHRLQRTTPIWRSGEQCWKELKHFDLI
jgi:hypothetical protein